MGKRKDPQNDAKPVDDGERRSKDQMEEDEGEDFDMLDVEFEWFDPEEIDFHGLKALLRQLFDVDNQLFNLSALANLVIAQTATVGSTVKVDGKAEDPFAFMSVVNMHTHQNEPFMQDLERYLTQKTSKGLPQLKELLSNSSSQVGLVLGERFINMPAEVSPPMYKMLAEEVQWAIDDKEPYNFSHYLLLSRTYTEMESKLDMEDERPSKKSKKGAPTAETYYFHPEDEIFHKHAVGYCSFDYTHQGDTADSKRAFQEMGIKSRGHAILIEAAKFEGAVKEVSEYIGAQS